MMTLRKILRDKLKAITPHVYYMKKPKDVSGPYLIYHILQVSSPYEYEDRFVLDIDGWDRSVSGDSTPLESLLETLDGDGALVGASGLHHAVIIADEWLVTFHRISRFPVDEKDEYTFHWLYSYDVKVVKKGV